MKKRFPFYRQPDQMDCGPTCLKMIAAYHGKYYSNEFLREKSFITREGVSIIGISEAAEEIGLQSLVASVSFPTLKNEAPLPCIVHWRQRHFIVVYKTDKNYIYVADPAFGKIKYEREKFLAGWLYNREKNDETESYVLLLEPTPEFYTGDKDSNAADTAGLRYILPYIRPHRRYIAQLVLGLVTLLLLSALFPFLTQAVVDQGIKNLDLNFIYLILAGQLMLFFSVTALEAMRSWILLHVGSRINIAIISGFLLKLMKLPMSFFDSKMTGDLMQRIDDQERVAEFLRSTTINVVFSFFQLLLFGSLLAVFNLRIFLLFLAGSCCYIIWVLIFVKKRARLDYIRRDEAAENRSSMLQLIQGMQEIKLNNSEKRRRWEWESIQVRLYQISVKGLKLEQLQVTGANFIRECNNILMTFLAASAVIHGDMTIGMMLSVQYMLGQLNGPLNSFITFSQSAQMARISIARMNEVIHSNQAEDAQDKITELPADKSISFENVSFRYGGPSSGEVLKDLTLEIPRNKITAIVGTSGSGKTTLLKLLLKFYHPTSGNIRVGNTNLSSIDHRLWRERCGAVMQDGFIFADTIVRNITESNTEEKIDKKKLQQAVHIANIGGMIEALPLGYKTNLSWGGISLSGGEEQRVLIARSVYKNPDYLLFDEATSALDANNEMIIMNNLQQFFQGKTVVIIAHRLSTVRNADNIIVMEKGQIVEQGTHHELTAQKGAYYTLVKNQLELGQ
ncbi:peptidase domain-containing ABC transporter [Chitinophaga sp. Mgbs1]|uniref:Peptidase domain-containing ABC transporter n=1 Tax=Chitinophaga solisilvae TaxID=1233460 RepID=A0A433WPQ5_9BACT|nr:peptidase domain-containing ABC transporter [Chitinophaga solisilvae]